MTDEMQNEVKHTPAAQRAAEAILGLSEYIDTLQRHADGGTIWRRSDKDAVAFVIDRETGLSELLAALELAESEITFLLSASGRGGGRTLESIRAAINKALGE